MGPFKVIGKVFGMIGKSVELAESQLTNISKASDASWAMAHIALDGVAEDLKADNILASAERNKRISVAQAEADAIMAELTTSKGSK
jgi:hypothetical protein